KRRRRPATTPRPAQHRRSSTCPWPASSGKPAGRSTPVRTDSWYLTSMSLAAAIKGKGPNGLGFASTAEEATAGGDLTGKTMLVTGCNSGLGFETIRALALRGARVIAAARTVDKAREACARLKGDFLPVACELSEPASVRAAVASVRAGAAPLDAIVCNAGVMNIPTPQQKFGCE